MAQQTAVEFAIEKYDKFINSENGNGEAYFYDQLMKDIEQAKAMVKRQMEELALYIYEYSVTCLEERINPDGKKKFEQYYNETYKK